MSISAVDGETEALNPLQEEESFLTKTVNALAAPFIAFANLVYPVNPVTKMRHLSLLPEWAEKALGPALYRFAVYTSGLSKQVDSPKIDAIAKKLFFFTKRNLPYEVKVFENDLFLQDYVDGGKILLSTRSIDVIDYYTSHKKVWGLEGYNDPETGTFISYEGVTREDVIAAFISSLIILGEVKLSGTEFLLSLGISLVSSVFLIEKIAAFTIVNLTVRESVVLLATSFTFPAVFIYFFKKLGNWSSISERYGVLLAHKAGYDPRGALFLQEIYQLEFYENRPKLFNKLQLAPSPKEQQAALFREIKALHPQPKASPK